MSVGKTLYIKCNIFNNVIVSCMYVSSTVRPTITLKSPTPVELDEGSSTTLLCFATGNPKPTYTWQRGSTVVQGNADSNYTIASANKDHAGLYKCTATVTAPGVGQYSAVYSVEVKVRCKLPSFIVSRTSVYYQFI